MKILQSLRFGHLSVWIRCCVAFGLSFASTAFIESRMVENALRRPLIQPVGIDASPVLMLGIFLGLYAWSLIRDDLKKKKLGWPSFDQIFPALLLWASIIVLAVWLTHPSGHVYSRIQLYALRNPETGPPAVASALSVIELLPAIPLVLLVFPFSLIRQSLGRVFIGGLLLLVYAIGPVLEAAYYGLTGPPLVTTVRSILSLIPGTVPANLSRWEIGYGTFRVTLGYACTDFSALLLFIGLFGLVWWHMAKKRHIMHVRAIGALLTGIVSLWMLNALRITLIVLIGSKYPTFALNLFHSGVGIVIFLCFFIAYVKLVLPFVQMPVKEKIVRRKKTVKKKKKAQ